MTPLRSTLAALRAILHAPRDLRRLQQDTRDARSETARHLEHMASVVAQVAQVAQQAATALAAVQRLAVCPGCGVVVAIHHEAIRRFPTVSSVEGAPKELAVCLRCAHRYSRAS